MNCSNMDKRKSLIFKKVGGEIRRLRLERELTLEDMQDHGFSPQHFQKVESGKKEASFYTLCRVAKAFKVKVSDLVSVCD